MDSGKYTVGQTHSPLISMKIPVPLVNLHTLVRRIVDNGFDRQDEDGHWGMAARAVAHQTWHIAVTATFIVIAVMVKVNVRKIYRAALVATTLTVPSAQASPCGVNCNRQS